MAVQNPLQRPKQTSSQSLTCTFSDQQDETKKVGKILKNETAVPGAQFLVRYSSSQSEASTTGTRSGVREPVGIGGVSHPPLAKATNWNRESPTELFYDVVALCGEAREYRKWNRRGASDITSRCFPCGDFSYAHDSSGSDMDGPLSRPSNFHTVDESTCCLSHAHCGQSVASLPSPSPCHASSFFHYSPHSCSCVLLNLMDFHMPCELSSAHHFEISGFVTGS